MIELLSKIKMTLGQWLGLLAASIIGVLVLALKLQGSRLHKAKIDLLREQVHGNMEKNAAATEAARKRYQEALDEYERHRD